MPEESNNTPSGPGTLAAQPRPGRRKGFAGWVGATKAGRRTVVGIALILALAGIGFLAYPWLTDVYTRDVVQKRLAVEFKQPATRIAYERREVKEGDGLTRILIPRLGVDTIVVEGVSPAALRAGAGHYPDTPLPGEAGNMAIAGHRVTYGKPFADVDQLVEGDEITLETPLNSYTYRVSKPPFISEPDDLSVLDATPAPTLTLTACHPPFSAAQRVIVQAAIVPELSGPLRVDS